MFSSESEDDVPHRGAKGNENGKSESSSKKRVMHTSVKVSDPLSDRSDEDRSPLKAKSRLNKPSKAPVPSESEEDVPKSKPKKKVIQSSKDGGSKNKDEAKSKDAEPAKPKFE
jgi:hypothetical protein